ncbi:MAG: VOC family protein [Dongiaceae bacterium]
MLPAALAGCAGAGLIGKVVEAASTGIKKAKTTAPGWGKLRRGLRDGQVDDIGADMAETSSLTSEIGVHSLNHFALAVPDLKAAETFYTAFGLIVQATGNGLLLKTAGHPATWGHLVEGPAKRLHHLSFGIYEADLPQFRARLQQRRIAQLDPPPGFESNGFWFRDGEGNLVELRVAEKTMPDSKSPLDIMPVDEGLRRAPARKDAGRVQPTRLSHVLIFARDVEAQMQFYTGLLGLRLSDRSGDGIAFMHGIHGSDHHLLALVKSAGPGLHHCSWDVPSIHQIGLGAELMAERGFGAGWGLGRHVLGSNYFHYVRDPWGSYSEYSCDIDYIPKGMQWPAGDYAPQDSFYVWGPTPPKDFAVNYELEGR